jgi:hypothetical protein
MSKSNKYGYAGADIPSQSFGSNKGLFDPAEINELVAENKWTQYGQLELIQTQTISSASCDFTSLSVNTYDVHLFVYSDLITPSETQTEFTLRVSDDGGTSYETSNYHFGNQRGYGNGTFSERRSTSQASIRLFGDITGASNVAPLILRPLFVVFSLIVSVFKILLIRLVVPNLQSLGLRYLLDTHSHSKCKHYHHLDNL